MKSDRVPLCDVPDEWTVTCGYKQCQPIKIDESTYIIPGPVILFSNVRAFVDWWGECCRILHIHGQRVGHKRIKTIDI